MVMSTFRPARWLWIAGGAALLAAGCGSADNGPTWRELPQPAASPPGTSAPAQPAPRPVPSTPDLGTTHPSTPPTAAHPPTAHPQPAGPARCHTGDLSARLGFIEGAAGNRYSALVLTNRSGHTCTVYGYGGLQLLDANRQPVPTRQARDPQVPPQRVLLRPGMSAHADLHWGAVPSGDESVTGPCEPEPAYLLVTPPDETRSLRIGWAAGPVCQHGVIDQGAYRPGAERTD